MKKNSVRDIEWLKASFRACHSLRVVRCQTCLAKENQRLDLSPTVEILDLTVVEVFRDGRSYSGGLTITGHGVADFKIATEMLAEVDNLMSLLHLEFPNLESFTENTPIGPDDIDMDAIRENFHFGKLKHMEFHNLEMIAVRFIEHFRPMESVFWRHFVHSPFTGLSRGLEPSLREVLPPKIVLVYRHGVWKSVQILYSVPQVREIYVVSLGVIWEDAERYKWLECWPGDKNKYGVPIKVRRDLQLET